MGIRERGTTYAHVDFHGQHQGLGQELDVRIPPTHLHVFVALLEQRASSGAHLGREPIVRRESRNRRDGHLDLAAVLDEELGYTGRRKPGDDAVSIPVSIWTQPCARK